MRKRINRRQFLKESGAAGVGFWTASTLQKKPAPKLNIALVGVGGRGSWFVGCIPRLGQNVVALCDVNQMKATQAYERFPDVPKFRDFRRMLDEMDKKIDAVIVATPDHIHAPASAAAIRRGKHVYTEKPLTHEVHEARVLRKIAREHKVATQMGNQGTASQGFRQAMEIIRAGAIGEVREVHVWKDGGGSGRREPPKGSQPVPDFLDWNLWLGPAADRPFHREWMSWHRWRDFATGNLGNWGSHSANLAFKSLRVDSLWHADPEAKPRPLVRLEAKVSEINRIAHPKWEVIRYEIPARGDLPPLTLTWHNGRAPGSREHIEDLLGDGLDFGDKKEKKWVDHAGILVVGKKGRIQSNGHNTTFRLLPEKDFKDFELPSKSLHRSPGHEREWLLACAGDKPAWSNFDYSGPLAEFLLLGNVATQFEGKLEYDPVEGKIVNHAKANEALRREYRSGWTL